MALCPVLFDDTDFWKLQRAINKNFGWSEDYFRPIVSGSFFEFPQFLKKFEEVLEDSGAQVSCDKDKFQANFDVQHFKPEEISVKISPDRVVTIEGKHEEKQDEHGHIYRHFVRKYTLPENCDVNQLQSKLSSDGVLSITAPRVGDSQITDRTIPIVKTGKPIKSIENQLNSVEK